MGVEFTQSGNDIIVRDSGDEDDWDEDWDEDDEPENLDEHEDI